MSKNKDHNNHNKKAPKLTDKQMVFAMEYVKDKNGTQAAIRAGYSAKTAQAQASRLLTNVMIRSYIDEFMQQAAKETQTDVNWVRQRLKEEAMDFSEFSSHAARIRAIELIAKLNGDFEKDNKQKLDPLAQLLGELNGKVLGPGNTQEGDEDE